VGRVRPGRTTRPAHQWRRNRESPSPRRLGGSRRRHAAADRPHQHGSARGFPDLTRYCSRYCAGGGGGPGGAERPERSVARSRRNIPHFPSAGRSDIAGYGGIPRRGQRRGGATAATPAGRVCGSFRGRDADIGGIKPLTGNSSFRRKLRHNHSSHIAGPCPPCYDHAACGGSEGEDQRMSAKNGAIKLVAGNSNPVLAEGIAAYLKLSLTKAVVRRFADMEIFVEIQENVRGADLFVIQSTSFPANDHLMELLIIIDALR